MDKKYLRKLVSLFIALIIFIGIPYKFGELWFWLSWIPALVIYEELER